MPRPLGGQGTDGERDCVSLQWHQKVLFNSCTFFFFLVNENVNRACSASKWQQRLGYDKLPVTPGVEARQVTVQCQCRGM